MMETTSQEHAEQLLNRAHQQFNSAIDFAIEKGGPEGLTFLSLWRVGAWNVIAKEFPDFKLPEIGTMGRVAVGRVDYTSNDSDSADTSVASSTNTTTTTTTSSGGGGSLGIPGTETG